MTVVAVFGLPAFVGGVMAGAAWLCCRERGRRV